MVKDMILSLKEKQITMELILLGHMVLKFSVLHLVVIKFLVEKVIMVNFIEIDHGFGIVTRYGHLNKLLVKKGDVINRGDAIAKQGNTGRSKGHHLHYEVKFKDKYFNPEKFLKAGQYVF